MTPVDIVFDLDLSESAELIYNKEKSKLVQILSKILRKSYNPEIGNMTDVIIDTQTEITKALIRAMNAEDVSAWLAGRLLDDLPEIMKEALKI